MVEIVVDVYTMRKNQRFMYIFAALLVALFLFLATGYHGWHCGGSAFTGECKNHEYMKTVGGLLITAGILIFIAAVIICFRAAEFSRHLDIAAAVVVCMSTVLSCAAVFYYYNNIKLWSPFIASMGMTISFALFAVFIVESFTSDDN